MSAFWKYIKGYDENSTATYIHFRNSFEDDYRPWIGNGTVIGTEDSGLGFIVTTNHSNTFYKNQYINDNNQLIFNTTIDGERQDGSTIQRTSDEWIFSSLSSIVFKVNNTELLTIATDKINCKNVDVNGIFNVTGASTLAALITSDLITANNGILVKTGSIQVSNGSVSANYFNATSDRRLKSDIEQTTESALDFVLSVPIYTFHYNSDPRNQAIGIIAQEVENKEYCGFNLVKKPKSKDGFLEVKESKMVYILWKAIQEQQEQIQQLQAQLQNLTNQLNPLVEEGETNDEISVDNSEIT